MAGFSFASSLSEVAPDFPDTKFVIIDMVVDAPNVRSTVFKEQEGSYLVGMMAAMASESGTVGFVGGMDIPLIRRFACGYVLGVRSINSDAKIIQNYTGTTYHAWNDPIKGGELTKAQISQGADVVYHAAGGTGLGVLQAAADAGKLGIGVDKNQNHLQSGSVLTSMVKRVDVAVYNAFTQGAGLTTGFDVMGLSNGGVGYSMDSHNASLVSADMEAAVEAAKAKIIAGEIEIHDAMSDNSCPAS
jgi:basic membrane protein A